MRTKCNIDNIGQVKKRLRPDGRGCMVCGTLLSRHGKWRCYDCNIKYKRTLIGAKNPQYKGDNASSVAINRSIIVRHGHANNCSNINCNGESRTYKWARLKARSGRESGIWIQLCSSCRLRLSDIYQHNVVKES